MQFPTTSKCTVHNSQHQALVIYRYFVQKTKRSVVMLFKFVKNPTA